MLEADDEVARVAVAAADQRPAARADAPADERARVGGGVVRIDEPVWLQLLRELQHVDPGLHGHRAVLEVDLEDLVHQLDVDDDPVPKRHRAVGEPRAAGARDDRDALAVGELDDLGDLLGRGREHDGVGGELLPTVDRERRGDAGAVEARRAAGEDVLLAADLDELVDRMSVGERDRHLRPRIPPRRRPAPSGRPPRRPASRPARSAAAPTRRRRRRGCRSRAPSPSRPGGG